MRSEDESNDMYVRLMAINSEAFAGRHFEVAYHALTGALHCARESNAIERIAEVERVATQQVNWIDAHAPAHPLSSQAAHARGNESVFRLLAHQAAARGRMVHLKSETRVKE